MAKMRFEFRIVLIYLLVGAACILFSDYVMGLILQNPQAEAVWQANKGLVLIVLSALYFYIFLKRNLDKMEETERKALESDRMKTAFIGNLSHEIRIPMNSIIGFSKMIRDPSLEKEQQEECAKVIEESGRRLLNIINDLMAFSRQETGQMTVSVSESDIIRPMVDLFDSLCTQAELKGIGFVLDIPSGTENLIVRTDHNKLLYILRQLLQNAMKYTEDGSIALGFTKAERHLHFFVKDTGIGIPGKKLKSIFDPFIQVDQSITKSDEGVGLGLTIASAYTDMLGGKIWANSKMGEGTTFNVTIPYQVISEVK
jgi:signal transduction histidine kinase